MFSKAIVTPTGVIAGKLRLRFRGLFHKVHAIQDVDVSVPTTAAPLPKTDKLPTLASTIIATAAFAIPHSSQTSQTSQTSSESEYSNELSEVSSQTDSASEPSTREFPVTPRNDQSPQSSYDFDSAPYDNDYEASVFGGVACGKEVYKELELDGEELEGNAPRYPAATIHTISISTSATRQHFATHTRSSMIFPPTDLPPYNRSRPRPRRPGNISPIYSPIENPRPPTTPPFNGHTFANTFNNHSSRPPGNRWEKRVSGSDQVGRSRDGTPGTEGSASGGDILVSDSGAGRWE